GLAAVRFGRRVILAALKGEGGGGGRGVGRVQRVRVALRFAIGVPLIVLSGISLDRVRSTATADLGFASDLLYAVPLKVDADKITNADFRIRSERDDLAKANGVAAATLADSLPLASSEDFRGDNLRAALQPEPNAAPKFFRVRATRVDSDYLNTMGIALLRGRGFSADDRAGTESVTIISKTFAEQLFPNADSTQAIGKRLIFGNDGKTQQTRTIVGVSGDIPTSGTSR